MEIIIKYNSIWGNSFISPDDNKNRKYIASLSSMNNGKNKDNKLDLYKKRTISLTTVYGLVYRLMGARSSLKTLLSNDKSFVSDLIKKNAFSFEDTKITESDEIVYIRNNSLNTDQNSYSGVPNEDIFNNGLLQYLDVLFYSRDEMINFLLKGYRNNKSIQEISVIELSKKIEDLYKDKSYKIEEFEYEMINSAYKNSINKDIHEKANLALLSLNKSIKEFSKKSKESSIYLTDEGTFSGVSLNGNSYTLKDFMKKFAASKIVYGNPYITDFWVKNPNSKEGKSMKFNKMLNKSDGLLKIKINCTNEQALKIKENIDNSGVSSFYLGKKGLAYTDKIIL